MNTKPIKGLFIGHREGRIWPHLSETNDDDTLCRFACSKRRGEKDSHRGAVHCGISREATPSAVATGRYTKLKGVDCGKPAIVGICRRFSVIATICKNKLIPLFHPSGVRDMRRGTGCEILSSASALLFVCRV
jgi:hypothetical protein